MNILSKIAIGLTGLLFASTIICGFSIAGKDAVEASSLMFHAGFGITAVLLSFASIILVARSARLRA